MRQRVSRNGVTVNAIAGTYVVLLGFDLSVAKRKGCLGFAVRREDHTEDERYWMSGMKTFEVTNSDAGLGSLAPSNRHPFQTFQWADYSAKPAHKYTYTVYPVYGTPEDPKPRFPTRVRVDTEKEFDGTHSVFFNRGAVASQEFARRFGIDRKPSDIGPPAYVWLSRGLIEAFKAFVGRASGKDFGLYGAIYEFQWPDALEAIRTASKSGADVSIVYDGIPGESKPVKKNETAIRNAKIKGLCKARTTGTIMHNKFLVLTRNQKPIAVWTGSTNLTENGIFGHGNCGHVIEDAKIAEAYLAYWQQLKTNPQAADEKAWMAQNNPAPPAQWNRKTMAVFSPRSGLKVLEWYAQLAGVKDAPLFMTFAFGMHAAFQAVYEQKDGVLRFALMEQEGNGAGLPQGKIDVKRIRARPNVVIAVGKSIRMNSFDRWLKERDKLSNEVRVKYVHNKFMLVDPLGPKPLVITGSANFSKASTDANTENMVLIPDDKRVADIYLGEFMRAFSHYAFREAVAREFEKPEELRTWKPNFLVPDDSWQGQGYFKQGTDRFLRREYFSR